MNCLYELDRLKVYLGREGLDGAIKAGQQMVKTYLLACRALKKKSGGRKHPYRRGYVESAMSARFILRNKLLEEKT